jgi:hypothetical protein
MYNELTESNNQVQLEKVFAASKRFPLMGQLAIQRTNVSISSAIILDLTFDAVTCKTIIFNSGTRYTIVMSHEGTLLCFP